MKKMDRIHVVVLRGIFKNLRNHIAKSNSFADTYSQFANEDDAMIRGYTRALLYEKKMTEEIRDKIIDISSNLAIYGCCNRKKAV